jgi:hypothetical protein
VGQGPSQSQADGETEKRFKVKRSRFKVKVKRKPGRALSGNAQDRQDVEGARKALGESGDKIPYEKVRKELGLRRSC